MGPIDYTSGLLDPSQSMLSGIQSGFQLREMQQKQQAQQLALQQQQEAARKQQEMQQYLGDLMSNPNAGPRDFAKATVLFPQLREHFKQAAELYQSDAKEGDRRIARQAFAAINTDRPEIAAKLYRDRAEALKASGAPADAVQGAEFWASSIEQNPAAAKSMANLMMAGVDPDFVKSYGEARTTERADELQPSAVRKAGAEATKSEAEAKYAEEKQEADLKKLAADLKLSNAQVAQANATTKKLGVEAKKLALELESVGQPNAAQKFDAETKLRSEYTKGTAGYTEVAEAYRRLKAANNDAAGDISLIFSYMKMLDPGSVVREGEFATAQNAAGVDTRIANIYNRLLNGERLTPGQRKMFTGQGENLFKAAETRESEVRTGIAKVAKNYGLNAENIFGGRVSEPTGTGPNANRPPLDSFNRPGSR